ncbi:MAG: hypothetical protein ACK559_33580, partial [bacterium]
MPVHLRSRAGDGARAAHRRRRAGPVGPHAGAAVTDGGLPRADEVEALAERMRARGKAWSAVGRAIADGAPLPLRRALDRVSPN